MTEQQLSDVREVRLSEQEIMRQSQKEKMERIRVLESEIGYLKTLLRMRTRSLPTESSQRSFEPMKKTHLYTLTRQRACR